QRIADGDDAVARAHAGAADFRRVLVAPGGLQQCEVVDGVLRDETQRYRRLPGQAAADLADAAGDDVVVGDEVPVAADDESAAALLHRAAGIERRSGMHGRS